MINDNTSPHERTKEKEIVISVQHLRTNILFAIEKRARDPVWGAELITKSGLFENIFNEISDLFEEVSMRGDKCFLLACFKRNEKGSLTRRLCLGKKGGEREQS